MFVTWKKLKFWEKKSLKKFREKRKIKRKNWMSEVFQFLSDLEEGVEVSVNGAVLRIDSFSSHSWTKKTIFFIFFLVVLSDLLSFFNNFSKVVICSLFGGATHRIPSPAFSEVFSEVARAVWSRFNLIIFIIFTIHWYRNRRFREEMITPYLLCLHSYPIAYNILLFFIVLQVILAITKEVIGLVYDFSVLSTCVSCVVNL